MTADDEGHYEGMNMDDLNEMFKNFGFGFNKKDMNDIFGGFEDFFGQGFNNINQRGRDIQTTLSITFDESINGTSKQISLNRPEECKTCKGTKMKPGSKKSTCNVCRGSGKITMQQGMMIFQQVCNVCNGEGFKISNPCVDCRGTGRGNSTSKIDVNIPAGVNDGQTLKMAGKGYPGNNGGSYGDLYIKLNVAKHNEFKRDGINLIKEIEIDFILAILGGKMKINTFHGNEYI